MNIHIYLDHNILDDISKGALSLKPSGEVIWVYSNENLAEIRRSGDTRFLGVLEELKARKLELILDKDFRITGEARYLDYQSPYRVYESYLDAISDTEIDQTSDFEFMARLFGSDNREEILSHPAEFEEQIRTLLEPHGMYTEEVKSKVERVRDELKELVNGPLQDIEEIEKTRAALGTHKGRAGNLARKENPIEQIWKLVKSSAPGMTADQYFGFDPIDKQGYKEWPIFLGIIGCHTMLNFLGFRPDDGLYKAEDIPRILSDGSHIAYAAYCQGLLSRDRRFIAKARAIYRYKNIGTQIFTVKCKKR